MTPLKRRQFGQLAAASLTSTVVAGLSSKAVAQRSKSKQGTLYGVNLMVTSNNQNSEDKTPALEINTTDLATGRILSRVNRLSLSVENPLSVPRKRRAFALTDSNQITNVIVLGDGTIITSTVSSRRNGFFNYLIYAVGSPSAPRFRGQKILGLQSSNQTIESLLSLPNNQLLCLIGTEHIPPFTLKTMNLSTGRINRTDDLALPSLPLNHRFANLCQDLQGNIFATEIGSEGIPTLISLNLQKKAMVTGKVKINRLSPLNFNGVPLLNDVKDLAFSPDGQLHALAAGSGKTGNLLFTVDVKTGKMELVRNFAGEKFVFSRS